MASLNGSSLHQSIGCTYNGGTPTENDDHVSTALKPCHLINASRCLMQFVAVNVLQAVVVYATFDKHAGASGGTCS